MSIDYNICKIQIDDNNLHLFPELCKFKNLKVLDCYNTQITSLDHLPSGLQVLNCDNCPLTEEYKGKTLPEIHLINKTKNFLRGISLTTQILAASKIQKSWKTYRLRL